eukprot:TRINITY_DN6685_c0_g1_i2.p1 TRINITY_DN6685_c0_g1~~TRINITY_DN6685_c0_g1_i2.p1  ORF type:complete len:233 (+),score=44.59 TRINITY_DN6685_c0_g1_i2:134-832(+)
MCIRDRNSFEMYAQSRLIPMLRPALKHVFGVLAERSMVLARLYQWSDLWISGGLAVLDSWHLQSLGATFGEHFYGLQRSSSFGRRRQPLSRMAVALSILMSVLLPAVKEHLDQWYKEQGDVWRTTLQQRARSEAEAAAGPPDGRIARWTHRVNQLMEFLRTRLVKVYPALHASTSAVSFGYFLLYLFGRTDFYSPLLHLQGTVVQRVLPSDVTPMLTLTLTLVLWLLLLPGP